MRSAARVDAGTLLLPRHHVRVMSEAEYVSRAVMDGYARRVYAAQCKARILLLTSMTMTLLFICSPLFSSGLYYCLFRCRHVHCHFTLR